MSIESDIAQQASQIAERTRLRKITNRYEAHVLVVDDIQTGVDMAAGMLRLVGCTVDVALSGKEALQQVADHTYDLILMDLRMPDMDGREVTMRIREMKDNPNHKTPIIALSADIFWQGDEDKCLKAGMNACLVKPLRSENLEAILTSTLSK